MQNFTLLFKKRGLLLSLFLLLFSISSFAQQQTTVSGIVTSTAGETLPGVSVIVKGTSIGAQTDVNGHYSIKVTGDITLVFSYVGYNSQEVTTGGRSKIDVKLTANEKSLSEVVVLGYGTANKKDVTGSVM